MVNLTKTLAWNLGPDIRVNAVAPGWMEGDWMQRMLGDKYDDLMGKRAKLTPLKRCVTADDVAETMLSLIQGQSLRHRRDCGDRRRLHRFDLKGPHPCCKDLFPSPPSFAAALPRARLLARPVRWRRNLPTCSPSASSRTALIDGARRYTYADIDRLSDNLALNLQALGLKPLDRVVPTLPNVAEFVHPVLRAAEDSAAIPIAALVTHRFAEINQFTQLSQATCAVYPETSGDFRFAPIIERVQAENPCLKLRIVLGHAGPGEHSLARTDRAQPGHTAAQHALATSRSSPPTPASSSSRAAPPAFPKLIPRTNNDYAYNSKVAATVVGRHGGFGAAAGAADCPQPAAGLPRHPGLHVPGRHRGAACQHPAGRDVWR